MATFPALKPNGRSWTPGALTQSSFTHIGGNEVRALLSSKRAGDVLRLSYENLQETDANLIIDHYVSERTTFNTFDLPVEVYAGISDYSAITVFGNKWRYARAPEVQYLSPDVQTVSVEFIQVIGGINLQTIVEQFALSGFAPTFTYTESDPSFSNVELLLHMDGVNGGTTFTDDSNNAFSVTANAAITSTANSKFGGASGFFNANTMLFVNMGTGTVFSADFTIECWFYTTNVLHLDNGSGGHFISNAGYSGEGTENDLRMWIDGSSSGQIAVVFDDQAVFNPGLTPSNNTWHHIALVRSGSTLSCYLDGVAGSTTQTNSGTNVGAPTDTMIGGRKQQAGRFLGYLDDFRITKGVARYTSNFTPPSRAFPNQ